MSGKKLMDVMNEVGLQAAYLEQASDALSVLNGAIADSLPENETENWKAVHFTHCFPAFLSALRVINRDIQRIAGELKRLDEKAEEIGRQQNVSHKT